jgi:4-hydroxybenzoyl-CoA thioesterase
MFTNTRELTIEWGHCDPAGIVFFPRYFEIFDACTAHLFATALGMTKARFQKHYDIVGIPLLDAHCKFHVPTTYGDPVRVESRVAQLGRSSFHVEHRLTKEGTLCVEGFEKRVWAGRHPDDPARMKGLALPEDVIARLSAPA